MEFFLWIKSVIEYIEGARDEAPARLKLSLNSPLWGVFWGILVAFIIIFCGQSSKFIYIDF